MASYVSREKGGIHVQAANRIILDYNAKTHEITEQLQIEAVKEGLPEYQDDCVTDGDTTFMGGECSTEFSL